MEAIKIIEIGLKFISFICIWSGHFIIYAGFVKSKIKRLWLENKLIKSLSYK
jgi:hypothetical protein